MHWNLNLGSCKVSGMDEESKKSGEEEPEEEDSAEDSAGEAPEEEPRPELARKDPDEDDEGDAEEDGEEKARAEKAEKEKAQANDELLKTRERMLRIAADFENFRKRSKKDLEDAEHKARVDILKEMLPVFDNLARAVEHGGSVQDIEPIIQGARMVTKQFEENLAKFGLKRIESVGEVFDPSIHDAIAQEESDEARPGTIVKEFLAGYMLGDKLLRAAMVVVAKAGPGGGEKKKEEKEENETDGGD
jgi:molecular chaperone GrpE